VSECFFLLHSGEAAGQRKQLVTPDVFEEASDSLLSHHSQQRKLAF